MDCWAWRPWVKLLPRRRLPRNFPLRPLKRRAPTPVGNRRRGILPRFQELYPVLANSPLPSLLIALRLLSNPPAPTRIQPRRAFSVRDQTGRPKAQIQARRPSKIPTKPRLRTNWPSKPKTLPGKRPKNWNVSASAAGCLATAFLMAKTNRFSRIPGFRLHPITSSGQKMS